MKAKSESEILDFLTPYAESLNLEIVEVSFKMAKSPQLTVYIDKAGGVDLNTCEKFHRAIDPLLDEADPIETAYRLEVSSPGIERAITRPEHFVAMKGSEVEVKLYAPIDGSKLYRGVLLPMGENGEIRIQSQDKEISFARDTVAKISTYFEFN